MTHTTEIEEREETFLRVAEKVGWRELEYTRDGFLVGHPPGKKIIRVVPSYCLDVKAAWELVEFLAIRQIRVCIKNVSLRGFIRKYEVVVGEDAAPLAKAVNQKVCLAICSAFLEIPPSALNIFPEFDSKG